MEFKISQELAQAILNYLAEKPYKETFMLIAELQKLTPVNNGSEPLAMALPEGQGEES